MKNIAYVLLASLILYSCGATKDGQMSAQGATSDTIKIGNDSLDFKLLVFEPGFDTWLTRQMPIESYNVEYLKSKNRRYVNEYNRRAMSPTVYGNLYPQPINYDYRQDYGRKLNYMLFMYFEYFQQKYDQRL